MTAETDRDPAVVGFAASCVRLLMQRHGIPKRRYSTVISEVLELSYPAAHRKAQGATNWTIPELHKVAAYFGDTLLNMLECGLQNQWHQALLVLGASTVPCRIWVGKIVDPPYPPQLVAIGAPGNWLVIPSTDARAVAGRSISRLVMQADSNTGINFSS